MRNAILTFVLSFLIQFIVNAQEPWRFAVVGDTHVGSSEIIAEMVPNMLADSVECVFFCGDIAEGGLGASSAVLKLQLLEWQEILAPLYLKEIGVYAIRGNHENDARNDLTAWNAVFSGTYALPQNGPAGEMNLTYSLEHKNALFICMDNYINIHQVNQSWLNSQFLSNTRPHVFVIGHEAAFKVFHADCLDDSTTARNIFWQSLSQAGVKVYFCGHDHFLDIATVDDGDGNDDNDIYQYSVGTGGGWLMSQFSNYNGINAPYKLSRIYHEKEYGYALVEINGDGENDRSVTITWKKRVWDASTSSYHYVSESNIVKYTSTATINVLTASSFKPVSVFPNPASSHISVTGFSGDAFLCNITGNIVWSGEVHTNEKIDVSYLPAGIYFFQNEYFCKKFFVIR